MNKLLLTGVALLMCGVINSAHARNHMTLYEINSFVSKMTSAVNNPNPSIGRAFLMRSVDTNASFYQTLNGARMNHYYTTANASFYDILGRGKSNPHYVDTVWKESGYHSPHDYYSHAYSPYAHPENHYAMGKTEWMKEFSYKKNSIPRYMQSMTILNVRRPVVTSSATVDIKLQEYGVHYSWSPYGHRYEHKVNYSVANCVMSLKKKNGDINLAGMSCDKLINASF